MYVCTSGVQEKPLGPRVLLASGLTFRGRWSSLTKIQGHAAAFLTLKAEWFDTLTVKQWEIMINNDLLLFSATGIYPMCRRPLPFSFVARLHASQPKSLYPEKPHLNTNNEQCLHIFFSPSRLFVIFSTLVHYLTILPTLLSITCRSRTSTCIITKDDQFICHPS